MAACRGHGLARAALPPPIPKLCTLVVASAFDAALHDAYGKAFGVSVYDTYGPAFMTRDLSHDLGAGFAGEYLDRYMPAVPRPTCRCTIRSAPAIRSKRPTFARGRRWAAEHARGMDSRDGLIRFKIKLNGDDSKADLERIVRTTGSSRVFRRAARGRWKYLLDFNERCPDVAYLLELLRRCARRRPPVSPGCTTSSSRPRATCGRIGRTSCTRPQTSAVVIDESLTDLERLLLAREMGYTGVALKACKGQTQAMLMAAAAQKFGMFLCVQDLTCPGASLIHSAGIAAHVPGNAAIEANSRQFVPGQRGMGNRFPGIFTIRDGMMATGQLTGPGLGAVSELRSNRASDRVRPWRATGGRG